MALGRSGGAVNVRIRAEIVLPRPESGRPYCQSRQAVQYLLVRGLSNLPDDFRIRYLGPYQFTSAERRPPVPPFRDTASPLDRREGEWQPNTCEGLHNLVSSRSVAPDLRHGNLELVGVDLILT